MMSTPSRRAPGAAARPSRLSRRLRLWRWRLARATGTRWALPALFAGSVIESSVLPWPIEFPLLAQMLRGRRHVFPAAFVVILGSALGCLLSWLAGVLAFALVQSWLQAHPAIADSVAAARLALETRGPIAVFLAMMTPVPVQLTSLAAGLAGLPLAVFLVAVLAGRAVRYLSMAVLVFWFGEGLMAWWRRQPRAVRGLGVTLFALAFVVLFVWVLAG